MKSQFNLILLSFFLFLNSAVQAELKTGLRVKVHTDLDLNPQQICSGYTTLKTPSLGSCPAGTVGIAVCYQPHKIPYKLTINVSDPLTSFQCELDYSNMESIGEIECDYSRCMIVDIPHFFGMEVEIPIEDWIWE